MHEVTQIDLTAVRHAYQNLENYRILSRVVRDSGTIPRCVIFFSSHGIYFPNTDAQVRQRIFEEDRYEWKKNIPVWANKVIFLRDVQKQWYLEGINSRLDTPAKVLDMLREETKGHQISCVGSSAGGYAAMLYGNKLAAERIISYSGQVSLDDFALRHPGQNPLVTRYMNDPRMREYFDITSCVQACKAPVFHLYAPSNSEDFAQARRLKDCANVVFYPFRYGGHGVPCYLVNCVDLMDVTQSRLLHVAQSIGERGVSPLAFSLKVSGFWRSLPYAVAEIKQKFCHDS